MREIFLLAMALQGVFGVDVDYATELADAAIDVGQEFDIRPAVLLSLGWHEGRLLANPRRRGHKWSKQHPSSICSMFQLTGGRYGIAPCEVLVKDWKLAMRQAAELKLAVFRRHCGKDYVRAYNAGYAGCCSGPYWRKHKDDPDRRWVCHSTFPDKVFRDADRLEKEVLRVARKHPKN
jgi:hypothetical protein